jgi:two-component system cell cycle response regulator
MSTKILTVDDSKMVRMIVASTFKPYDCEIVGAADGGEGVEVAIKEQPNLIFLDITMPVLDGLQTLQKIRETPSIAHIPVVMLTAESDGQRLAAADSLNVSGYIPKPFKPEQLIELTSKIVPLSLKA